MKNKAAATNASIPMIAAALNSGTPVGTQTPLLHSSPAPHPGGHVPPQPSSPHCLPSQSGVHMHAGSLSQLPSSQSVRPSQSSSIALLQISDCGSPGSALHVVPRPSAVHTFSPVL